MLAEALCAADFDGIPRATAGRAADCILDALGAAAAGRGTRSTQAMHAVMSARAGPGLASVWFGSFRCDPISAATVNAMAATSLDIDDGHRKAAGHAGAAVVSAALSHSEHLDVSMAELLTATVVGYEAAVRVALARKPEHHGSTVSGRWSGIGSAAATARLLRLPPGIMAEAILIAEQHAPRTSSAKLHGFAGSDVKEAIAWSVLTGLHAVELARSGFTGYPDTFDQGILYDPEVLCRGLGRFDATAGLFFKPYACCRWIHAAIDGLRDIMESNGLDADRIESVRVRTFDAAIGLGNHVAPESEAQAQFSIPFCLAVAALHGRSALAPMDAGLLRDQDVREFARKVSIQPDAAMNAAFPERTPAIVEIETAGAAFRAQVDAAFGDPANPMRRADLQRKFERLVRDRLSPDRIERFRSVLSGSRSNAGVSVRYAFSGLSDA